MLLSAANISKQFNGVYALKGVDLEIEAGEIHGLVGENGAGKSTLIKILAGVYPPDEGSISFRGQTVRLKTPKESRALGIHVIHQDRTLIPSFSAVENVYLGMEYPKKNGRIDWKRMEETVREKAEELGIAVDFSRAASQMTPPQKTCLEIVRAMMTDCGLLILDEPTASLTEKEADVLFGIIEALKEKGTSVLYVTHRMDEIFRLTDRVTVLKNGTRAGVVKTASIDKEGLIRLMTDEWSAQETSQPGRAGELVLEVSHLASEDGIVRDASLKAYAGEILGVFGLGGSGRTELLETAYGYRKAAKGTIALNGEPCPRPSPHHSIKNGMVLISEDRRGKAMIGGMNVRENITLSCIDRFAKSGVIKRKRESEDALKQAQALDVKMTGIEQRSLELSGGNQQKVVFAKALMTHPKILLCDEPTQAVDVKTRSELHALLRRLADQGSAVVFVSSDLQEVLEVSDVIQIMAGGCTRQRLVNEGLTSQQVLSCCFEN